MMLKEMLKSCKANKTIIIEWFGEQKFLSDGRTMMCIDRVAPEWTDEDCAVCLELCDEEKEAYQMINNDIRDENTAILISHEQLASRLDFSLNINGVPVQPFLLKSGEVVFCDLNKLRIFRDEGQKIYYFKMEKQPMMYITVNGSVIGAVTPIKIGYERMKDFCTTLFNGVCEAEKQKLLCEEEQMSLI